MNTDDWVPVTEDFPQIERNRECVSVFVLAKTDHETFEAFYCYRDREWYKANGKRVKGDVVAWQSI